MATLVLLAACGTHDALHDSTTGELFARGIDEISDLYIEPISAQKLVFVGAKNLTKLDARLGVSVGGEIRDRDQVTLTYDGIVLGNYRVPPDIDGGTAGDLVGQLIAVAKRRPGTSQRCRKMRSTRRCSTA